VTTLALLCVGRSRLKRIYCSCFWSSEKKEISPVIGGGLSGFNVAFWCTDNFSAYDMLPDEKHIRGKLYTQWIEHEHYLV